MKTKSKTESRMKRGNAAAAAARGLSLVPLSGSGSARELHCVLPAAVL